ncbi:putative disease resistance protein RGA3 [Oryza glaberrima]|uniref:putative disease resistance protein RGA3 n=1 Tax=Oryza glaberrima TaxID=4538 RepID=UPI00023DF825|nr:putative disease resistance protein RGA3 [Oryza glaberrima]
MATILDSLVGSCANKLKEIITEEVILILGIQEELAELQRKTELIHCCISDAEARRMEESAVDNWLGQLREVLYDVDDIIDLARFKGSILLTDHPSSSSRKSIACTGLSISTCFSNVQASHEVAVKIRSLNRKIENISKDRVFLTLKSTVPTGSSSVLRVRKSSHLLEPNIVGKEIIHACRKMVDLVLEHKGRKLYKLAIVGTGGVGKTTLAQKIYNDRKIKGSFNKKAWVCVSKVYSEASLLRELLRIMEVHHDQDESIGELQSKLEIAIKETNFLLVLDDMWQSDAWENLLRIPLHAAETGTILITTRNNIVALEIGVDHTYRVDLMSTDVGWELLWKSMNISESIELQTLQDVGIEIVRKCGCLPLAIKVIARVLASKEQTENEWKKILSKNAWFMNNLPNDLRGALYLSYDELPRHLKQCFLYCSVYPEDANIYRDDLTRMWIAEGFIEDHGGQLLEETADEYYYELIHRNLLQPDGLYYDHSSCKMHDLLRQLACYLSREESFVGNPESLVGNTVSKLRRVSVVTDKNMAMLPSMDKVQCKVRTWRTSYEKTLRVDNSFFKRFPYLRVLDLTDSFVPSIPRCIGNLIHLRLLDLDGTNVSCLPESIGNLKNLQILNSLPSAITQLCNLRRLGLNYSPLDQVPKGIGKLEFLNDVEGFPVYGGSSNTKMQDGWNLEELAHLYQLRRLHMIKLERAAYSTTYPLLTDKGFLKFLYLWCTERTDEPYTEKDFGNIEKIFEQLIPPCNQEDLAIVKFFGRQYPFWIDSTHLAYVKSLHLFKCKFCMHLPPVGQLPNLKYLKIEGAAAVTIIGPEFAGRRVSNLGRTVAFPKLEELLIRDMPNWEEWFFIDEATSTAKERVDDGDSAMPKEKTLPPRMQILSRLRRLELSGCPKLKALPRQLAQINSLKEIELRWVSSLKVVENFPLLSETLLIATCQALEKVSNLPQVRELRVQDCPNLRLVEELGTLEQLWLYEDMHEVSTLWVQGLQQQCRQCHGEDLDVYNWT